MASKKSKFETKYTFKGNSKLNNKYANIYEDIEQKKDAFYNNSMNLSNTSLDENGEPIEVQKTVKSIDDHIKSTVREVSHEEAELNAQERKKSIKNQRRLAMQKSSPVVSKRKTPELDRELSLEKLKREKRASKQSTMEDTKNMSLDEILNELRRKASSSEEEKVLIDDFNNDPEVVKIQAKERVSMDKSDVEIFKEYSDFERTSIEEPNNSYSIEDLKNKTKKINLEDFRFDLEKVEPEEDYYRDEVRAQESAVEEIMRRKKAEEARDKKESRRSRQAKRQEQEAIRRVNQSIGNVGTSRAEVYKRGRQDKSSKLNVKKIVTLLILLALIGIFIAAAADKYMTYKRENPITKVETSKTKDKAKEKTSPKTTQKKVSLEDKKKKLENIKSKLNYDEAKGLEYIIENIGSYPEDLIDLLLRNNETVDYVYSYKDKEKYNARKLAKNVTSSYHVDGEVPLFLQWDRRWGYRNYGSEMIGLSGCGPTSLAMVIRHFDSKSAVNPYDIAKYSQDNNYVSNTNTTSWKLFEDGIKKFDLQSVDVLPVEAKMKKSLDGGHVLIASLNPGLFSTRGHIIVIKGYNSDGDFLINDPNSIVNTNKAWSFDELKNYLRKIWGVSRIKSSDEDVSNSMSRGGDSTGDNEDKKQSSGGDGDSSDPSIIQDIE